MGARTWIGIVAVCVGAVLAGWILFIAFGWAWATWGFFGALAALTAIALAFGWYTDRREAKRRGELAA
jgi:Kef-type K+ transport system membrane component KefB